MNKFHQRCKTLWRVLQNFREPKEMKSYTTLIERKITVDRQLCRACQVGIGKRQTMQTQPGECHQPTTAM